MYGKLIGRAVLTGFGILVAGSLSAVSTAHAEGRYTSPPPVVLSPDLTEPWQLQLTQPNRARVVTRSSKSHIPTAAKKTAAREDKERARKRSIERRLGFGAPAQSRIQATTHERRQNIDPRFLPQTVAYNSPHQPGTVVIDTNERYLYLVLANGEARRYGVGVGKPGFEWAGTHRVTRKAEWPSWTPPKEMIEREKANGRILPNFMPGGPANPLGARALYLGSTLYRIHGTNAPWTIGQAVSSGCIRMRNQDVEDLYPRVPVGAKVIVI